MKERSTWLMESGWESRWEHNWTPRDPERQGPPDPRSKLFERRHYRCNTSPTASSRQESEIKPVISPGYACINSSLWVILFNCYQECTVFPTLWFWLTAFSVEIWIYPSRLPWAIVDLETWVHSGSAFIKSLSWAVFCLAYHSTLGFNGPAYLVVSHQ